MDLSNRFAVAFVLNLTLVAAGTSGLGLVDITVSAQESNACALVTAVRRTWP